MDVGSEASADAAAAATNGLGGGGRPDVGASAATNGLGGGGEASAEQRDVAAYAARYSGRTRLMRLLFISERCGVEAIQLEALRMAHDEAKAGEDTMLYGEVVFMINGRLGERYHHDQAWVDSVNRRAEERKEKLEGELNGYRTNLIEESTRTGYNDIGDFYYAHGHLSEAFKSYIETEEYCSASKHAVQLCMNAIRISIGLGHFARVLNYVSKAKGSQDPLCPITIAKLQVVEGLAYLGQKKYKLAALQFVQTGPELGNNYSEVVAPQDVALYGTLCSLAFFNYTEMKTNVVENVQFGYYLELVPEVRDLVKAFYDSQHNSCLDGLEKLKPRLMLDIHLAEHVEFLYLLILQKSEYMGSTVCDTFSEFERLIQNSSPILNVEEPHVNDNGHELNAVSNLILPKNFDDETVLADSTHYKFVKSKDLFESLGKKNRNWVSTCQAFALLKNGQLFMVDDFDAEVTDTERVDGQKIVVSDARLSWLKVEFVNYTTTAKPLKEKKLKSKEDAEIARFEMRGDIWARRRVCLRDNPGFHVLQWRRTSGLKRAQARQQEASPQNISDTLLQEVQVTMKKLVEELKANSIALTESSQAIAKSCQDVVDACKLSAASRGCGVVN